MKGKCKTKGQREKYMLYWMIHPGEEEKVFGCIHYLPLAHTPSQFQHQRNLPQFHITSHQTYHNWSTTLEKCAPSIPGNSRWKPRQMQWLTQQQERVWNPDTSSKARTKTYGPNPWQMNWEGWPKVSAIE
eukprot:14173385-Ditylum_brightwellii.AAC.1